MIKMIPLGGLNPVAIQTVTDAAKNRVLGIGVPANAVYPNGMKVSEVAFIQEFGNGKVLPRPFVRNTIVDKKEEWKNTFKERLTEALAGDNANKGVETALKAVGEKIKEDIKGSVETLVEPALKPSTVKSKKRKGRARPEKPLIDSGVLKDSIKVELL